jgi:leucyl-tRNA---protein transferase
MVTSNATTVLKVYSEDSDCSYLPERVATLDHMLLLRVDAVTLEQMLERGWRRFGPDYFRPACSGCRACVPTRLPVARFLPNKSQKRASKHGFTVRVAQPVVDETRLALYRKWHADREGARGWYESAMTERAYAATFSFPHPAGRELAFYDADKLIGVSIFDETPNALSAAYFYYDPAYQRHSLGTANVLELIAYAARTARAHLYLGFHVKDCPSLAYKGNFNPREILVGAPAPEEIPNWISSENSAC